MGVRLLTLRWGAPGCLRETLHAKSPRWGASHGVSRRRPPRRPCVRSPPVGRSVPPSAPPLSVRPAVRAVRSVVLGDVFGVGFLLAAPDSRKHPVYEISDILGTSVGSALPVVQEGLTNRRRRRRRRRPQIRIFPDFQNCLWEVGIFF